MAALVARNHNTVIAPIYQRLDATRKPKKLALVALGSRQPIAGCAAAFAALQSTSTTPLA